MSKNIPIKRLIFCEISVVIMTLSCAKSEDLVLESPVAPILYSDPTLTWNHSAELPMPSLMKREQAKVTADSGAEVNGEVRIWDINRDGRADMIEFIDITGKTLSQTFDFDGDGKLDYQKNTP